MPLDKKHAPFRSLIGIGAVLLLALPSGLHAKTIMWLGNWFQTGSFQNGDIGGVDSIWVRHSDTGTTNGSGYYQGAGNYKLTKTTTAYVDTARTHSANVNWWSIPTWNGNLYRENRFRMNISYKKFNGPTATPKYQNENSETTELNGRYTSWPGVIDSCLDMVPGDTVWMYWGLGQTASAQTKPTCSDHNPYLKTIGTIHLLNPWPGRTAYVLFNNKWMPLYGESGRPGWVSTTFYALPTAILDQKLVFASANPSSGVDIQYMDMTGIGAVNKVAPFDMSSLAAPWERWIAPAVDGTNAPKVLTSAPTLSTTLMVQKPTWGASAIRVTWQGVPGLFIAQSTPYCDWYSISFYSGLVPKSIILNHPFQDTIVGSKGIQKLPADMSAFADWITLPTSVPGDTLWLGTNGVPAALPLKPTGASVKLCNEKVLAFKVYDYVIKGSYYPFSEKTNSDNIKGIVGTKLGADGLPTYTGKSMCGTGDPRTADCTNKDNGPNNWFKARPDNTIGCLQQPLKLNGATGQYEYSSDAYFPLDTLITVSPYNETLAPNQTQSHDFGFCMHAKSTFEYVRGLTFSFRGDDDVWVFIDKTLALDLGGQHGPLDGTINLDKLNLLEGRAYQFDMFYCERHTPGSNIKIQTTMNLIPSYDFRFDSTAVGVNGVKIDLRYIKTEIDGSKCQDDAAQTPVPGKGYFFIQYPDGHTEAITAPPGASQFNGIAIAQDLTSVQVDLEAVKKNSQFKSRGTYKIVIRFQNDPSQANVKEIPFEISSGPVNLSADLYDADGDGKADSLVVHSPEAGTFQGADLKRTGIVWAKTNGSRDSLVIAGPPTSTVVGDSVAVFDWTAANTLFQKGSVCPFGGCVKSGVAVTYPASTPDSNVNPILVLSEHVAPYADSARLSFGTTGGLDTLRIWLGEGAVLNPAATVLDVWAKVGRPSAPRDQIAADFAIVGNGREVRLLLAAGHGIGTSDSLRVAGLVADSLLNASTNSSVWVPIRSNPLGAAALSDADGDGRADHLSVVVRGNLAGVASVLIAWKDAAGSPVSKTWTVSGAVSGSFTVDAGAQAFPKGATSCIGGGCSVSFLDAVGKTIENWSLIDSVAPMAVRGHYSFGTLTDTLWVKFSEPVASVSNLPAWLEWGSAGASLGLAMHSNVGLLGNNDSAFFVLESSNGIPAACDSIRMAVGLQAGRVVDLGGVKPGAQSPWAPVDFGIPPMQTVLRDPSGTGKASVLEVVPSRPVPASALASISVLRINWNNAQGAPDFRDLAFSSLVATATGWVAVLPVPFEFAATACVSGGCGVVAMSATGSRIWDLQDGVPPTLVRARYRFSGTGENADTMILRSSEPWIGAATTSLASFAMTGNVLPKILPMASWTISADGMETRVVMDSVSALLVQMDDSARYIGGPAGLVIDAFGNRPGDISPWRPIEFGLRPPTLQLLPYPKNGVLKNSKELAWEPPPAGIPATEILFMDNDSKSTMDPDPDVLKFKTPTGELPKNDLTKVLGVRILLNRPLDGRLIIYDNIGTHVAVADLAPMRQAWLADTTSKDKMREVMLVWNGTGPDGKFAASGVYLFRAVVKVDNGDGTHTFRNLVWKLGMHRDTK